MAALVDTVTSVMMIIGVVFGLHVCILLSWKFHVNWRYYNYVPQGPIRVVHVTKEAGERLGISLQGEVVREVDADSAMASLLSPKDRILMVNAHRVRNGKHAADLIGKVRRKFTDENRPLLYIYRACAS